VVAVALAELLALVVLVAAALVQFLPVALQARMEQ